MDAHGYAQGTGQVVATAALLADRPISHLARAAELHAATAAALQINVVQNTVRANHCIGARLKSTGGALRNVADLALPSDPLKARIAVCADGTSGAKLAVADCGAHQVH